MLDGRQILLVISGGIAAYKCPELVRRLRDRGAMVRCVLSRNAHHFVTPMSLATVSEEPVYQDLFSLKDEAEIGHIRLSREADLVVVAPATANFLGKLAGGVADDALTTLMLAATCPRLICPAMNTHMFLHPAVQRNLARLAADGHTVLPPDSGELACGTTGPGRLPDPAVIFDRVLALLAPADLVGRRVLVSAGPTHEPVDPVCFLTNPSSGRMGFAVARAAEHRGAAVTLVTGPSALPDPASVAVVRVTTAREMAEAVWAAAAGADVVVMTAAVSDFRPTAAAAHKIKKGEADTTLTLTRNPDILLELGRRRPTGQVLVGFAAETRDIETFAPAKCREKNLDLVVANLVGAAGAGFAGETNRVSLFFRDGAREDLPTMSKQALAHALLDRIARCRRDGE